MGTEGKIFKSREDLAAYCAKSQKQGKVVVFTNGVFDMLHPGHLETMRVAAAEGDVVVVGVNSDESVRRIKGDGRPVLAIDHRMRLLASLEPVDAVVSFSEDTPEELIKAISPDVLLKGGDYKLSDMVAYDHVKERGGRAVIVPLVEGRSTTNVVAEIKRRFCGVE